jgi:hypothetical protein
MVERRAVEGLKARSDIEDSSGWSVGSSQRSVRLSSQAQFAHREYERFKRIRLIHLDALSEIYTQSLPSCRDTT